MKINFTKFIFLLALSTSFIINAQTSSTSVPGTVANSTTSTGSYTWTIGTSTADCNLGTGFLYAMSKGLMMTNFNFSIPSGATILGITSKITYSSSVFTFTTYTQAPNDTIVRLVVNGLEAGNNYGNTGTLTATTPTNGNFRVYGSPTDKWGINTITPSDINSTEFGVVVYLFRVPYQAGISTVFLDNTAGLSPDPTPSITVYYSTSTGIVESQSASPNMYNFNKTLYFSKPLAEPGTLSLYDLSGKEIFKTSVEPSQKQLNLEQIPNGIYTARLNTANSLSSFKIKLD